MAESKKVIAEIFQQIFPKGFTSYQSYATHPTHRDTMCFCNFIIDDIKRVDTENCKLNRSAPEVLVIVNSLLSRISNIKLPLAELLQPNQTTVIAVRMLAFFLFRLQADGNSSYPIQMQIDQALEDINELTNLINVKKKIDESIHSVMMQHDELKMNSNHCTTKILEARRKSNKMDEKLKLALTQLKAINDGNALVLIKIKETESKFDIFDGLYEEKTNVFRYLSTYELLQSKISVVNSKIEKIETFKIDDMPVPMLAPLISSLEQMSENLEKLISSNSQADSASIYMEDYAKQIGIMETDMKMEMFKLKELEHQVQKIEEMTQETEEIIEKLLNYINERTDYKERTLQILLKVEAKMKETESAIDKDKSTASRLIEHYENVVARANAAYNQRFLLMKQDNCKQRF